MRKTIALATSMAAALLIALAAPAGATPRSAGPVRLVNQATLLCLTAHPRGPVTATPCDLPLQSWRVRDGHVIGHGHMCLTALRVVVVTRPCGSRAGQRWDLAGDRLRARGRCLDDIDSQGLLVRLVPCVAFHQPAQLWGRQQ